MKRAFAALRWTVVPALVAAALLVTGIACGAADAVFQNRYVTFRYPASWHVREWTPAGGELRFAVWLSNLKLPPACVRSGSSTRCSTPLRRLPPRAVFVTWDLSMPQGSSGRAVPLSVARPGACRSLAADETISIGFTGGMFVYACIRSPGVATAEQQVRAMLASAQVTHG
jgi:hypothetical protein